MIFSFRSKSKKKEHPALRKRKSRKPLSTLQLQLIVGFVLIVVISALIAVVYYATRIETLQIKQITVIGGETIPHSVIEQKVNAELVGSYLRLIPRHFIPLYPRQQILASIEQLDRVKNVQVEITKDQSLTVVFEEYIPYALWCEKTDSASCLFMDQQGYAFSQAPDLSGSAFIRYVADGVVPKQDSTGFDQQFMEDSRGFIDLLREQLSLYVVVVDKVGPYDIDYSISGGGVLKVSQSMPVQKTFDNLKTVLESDQFSHLAPGSFRYIDLRFGDKIFLNDSTGSTTASSSVTNVGN